MGRKEKEIRHLPIPQKYYHFFSDSRTGDNLEEGFLFFGGGGVGGVFNPGRTLELPGELGTILMWRSHPRIPALFGPWRDPDKEALSRVTLVRLQGPGALAQGLILLSVSTKAKAGGQTCPARDRVTHWRTDGF